MTTEQRIIKVESVFPALYERELLELLRELNIHGFTILDVLKGKGLKSGEAFTSGNITVNKNLYLFLLCQPEECPAICAALKEFLREVGGFVLWHEATLVN